MHIKHTKKKNKQKKKKKKKKTNIIFILSHIAYRKDQFICPVPWTHEELILKRDRETTMREKDINARVTHYN